MDGVDGPLRVAVDASAPLGGIVRGTVTVTEPLQADAIHVVLVSSVHAHNGVVHRERWSSATERRAGGFAPDDTATFEIAVPADAPPSWRFAAGTISWSVEATAGEATSLRAAVEITGDRRGRSRTTTSTPFEPEVPLFAFLLGVAVLVSLLYPAILLSRSVDSTVPTIVAAVVITAAVAVMIERRRRKEPFPFRIAERSAQPGGAVQIELDRPVATACSARLVTLVARRDTAGDQHHVTQREIDGPITRIDAGDISALVAIPASTPVASTELLDADTELSTRHFIEVNRYGAPLRSLFVRPQSRRTIGVGQASDVEELRRRDT